MKPVKKFMKKKVLTTKATDSIFKAAKTMSKHHISGLPVVNGSRVIGMITETDMIKFMKLDLEKRHVEIVNEPHAISVVLLTMLQGKLELKKELEKLAKIKVKDFMSEGVVSISPEEDILEAAALLDKYSIDRLPVINNGRLVGIISRSDLIQALVE